MRILLTGSKGQLGRCFKDRLPEEWELIAADSATLDITDAEAVLNMVKNFQPDAIVNEKHASDDTNNTCTDFPRFTSSGDSSNP